MKEVMFDIKELQRDSLGSTDEMSELTHSTMSIFFIVFFSFEFSHELKWRIMLVGFRTLSIVFVMGAWTWWEIDYFLALTLFWDLLLFMFWQFVMFEKAAFRKPLIGSINGVFWVFGGCFSIWLWFELKFTFLTGVF